MRNYIVGRYNKKWLSYDERGILVSRFKTKDNEAFVKKSRQAAGLNMNRFVPTDQIQEIRYNEKSGYTVIEYHNRRGLRVLLEINFVDDTKSIKVSKHMGALYGLVPSHSQEVKAHTLISGLAPILVSIIITWALYNTAIELEETGSFEITNPKKDAKYLIPWLVELMGSKGILGSGAAVTTFFILKAIHRYLRPAKVHIFEKER